MARRVWILTAGLAVATLAVHLVPSASAHPSPPNAGPHEYPQVFCSDGQDDLTGEQAFAPEISLIEANFNKHQFAVGEWLAWRPWWWNRDTGVWGTSPDWLYKFYPPNTMPDQTGDPFTLWRPPPTYGFEQGEYNVGVQYAWAYPGGFWTVDYTEIPNIYNTGYHQGLAVDKVCRLRPVTFGVALTGIFIPRVTLSRQAHELADLERSSDRLLTPSADSALRAPDGLRCQDRKPTLVGTEGPDVLVGTLGRDVILGLGGDDVIVGGRRSDLICGGAGNDGIVGENGPDRLTGDTGNDQILGGDGRDRIDGNEGYDIIEPGSGTDRVNGGGQALDILSYLFSPEAVKVDFEAGIAETTTSHEPDAFSGFNAVVGSEGDDILVGTSGEQWFVPMGGDDSVNGGSGIDVIAFVVSGQSVDVDLVEGFATGEGTDELSELEVGIGSPNDDVMSGEAGYSQLFGDEGSDVLYGVGGDDTLDGGGGIDTCLDGVAYFGCENQGGDVTATPPDLEPPPEPSTAP